MTASTLTRPEGRSRVDHVRLLEAEPELGAGLDHDQFAEACRRLVIPGLHVDRGPWTPPKAAGPMLGAMVLEGSILFETKVFGNVAARLFGPGDTVYTAASSYDDGRWQVLTDAHLAILDNRVALAALRWPRLGAALARRLMEAQEEQALRAAISTITGVEQRVLALLTHFANRWGRVSTDGLLLDLPLTHEMLGRLIGARRPTVSLALTALREQELLRQHPMTRHWIITAG
jgi:CRP/FNR family transcriptional regulator, cyclic AMP receptor protein